MPTIEQQRPYLTEPPIQTVLTGVDRASAVNRERRREENGLAWQAVIDAQLTEWLNHPAQFADEGVEAPSKMVVRIAFDVAEQLRNEGRAPPSNVLLDPDGGIVFENRALGEVEVIHIWDDGTVEHMVFQGTRLANRRPF